MQQRNDELLYDIAVIGGGINGCGIARDAAGRGLKVLLVEQNDLASGTSSASTKLIHGGLRYLEHYEFALVRASLKEREVLWSMAPHIIAPLRFVLPHHRGLRPVFLIRLGLFLYDHIGGRKLLPRSNKVNLTTDQAGRLLKDEFATAFEYSDCAVDDARLVVLNAMDAAKRGADICVRTKLVAAERKTNHWQLELATNRDRPDATAAETRDVKARVLVNAAGPWAGEVTTQRTLTTDRSHVRLVTGSHIIVPKMFDHDRAYIFQNADQRIVFAIPYEHDFTLIGTTDVDFEGDPADVAISAGEIDYLCKSMAVYFKKPIQPSDVVWSFAGIRPLYARENVSAQKLTRDFVLELDGGESGIPPLLSVISGKITTYRHLAEEAMEKLEPFLSGVSTSTARLATPWTNGATLPGGDFPVDGLDALTHDLQTACPILETAHAQRLVRAYGTIAKTIIGGVTSKADLGHHFGADLYQREVDYLVANEWAITAEDILWRRSKLGLRFNEVQKQALDDWLDANQDRPVKPAA